MTTESGPISKKRQKHLADVDMMPGDLRRCVHEFGYPIVQACIQFKVTKPGQIRQLVHEIWDGARQDNQNQKCGHKALSALDWFLLQKGAKINAYELFNVLNTHSLTIVPLMPTAEMLEASMNEVSSFNERVTKREKHARRLAAANKAYALSLNRLLETAA